MFKIYSETKAVELNFTILAEGNYALVGMAIKTAEIEGKNRSFYIPLLASVNEYYQITNLSYVYKDDLRTRPCPKIGYDGNGDTIYLNNNGSYVNAIDAQYNAHKGELVDVIWFRDILGNLRGKVFAVTPRFFQTISRKGYRYTTAVYKADFVTGAAMLNLHDRSVRQHIRSLANAIGFDEVYGIDPTEPLVFCDENNTPVSV